MTEQTKFNSVFEKGKSSVVSQRSDTGIVPHNEMSYLVDDYKPNADLDDVTEEDQNEITQSAKSPDKPEQESFNILSSEEVKNL